jgi:hypothetical protein
MMNAVLVFLSLSFYYYSMDTVKRAAAYVVWGSKRVCSLARVNGNLTYCIFPVPYSYIAAIVDPSRLEVELRADYRYNVTATFYSILGRDAFARISNLQ